jgi:flavin reductase (DIM6/NTAB) family NADH-FMN oxidoreductase RutF
MIDKFTEFSIKTIPAKQIDAPIIADALGSVECRLEQMTCLGDFYLVVGEVVGTEINQDAKGKAPILLKWGDKSYIGMSEAIAKEATKDEGLLTRVQKAVFGKKTEGQNGKK